jgi:hypothetical protein
MEMLYLKNILHDLTSRFSRQHTPHKGFLQQELNCLGEHERALIKKRVISLKYDLGASEILGILKKSNILSASEYLDHISDTNERLQIITDFFDDPGSSALLLEEILAEGKYALEVDLIIKNYVNDIVSNEDVIKKEMITTLEINLSKSTFSSCVLPKFLNTLLCEKSVRTLIDVISNQKDWNAQFRTYRLLPAMLSRLMEAEVYRKLIARKLMNLLKGEVGANWFLVLMIISHVNHECESFGDLKSEF